jgi:hypothetical protein
MKKITQKELDEIIRLHKLWIERDPKGRKADLSDCECKWLDFRGANL